ncbi:hypothetical protein KUTeg_024655 [Tegillarca granosa]|uniref:Uncharacterized protein n=1 Tax=Tegillarca granosa TaxID=220873 RepID=A0ABQ9E1Y0_TEGGR|nr:hypothetical protein KUTeg_024655 [Tegillarca granosa]
MLVEMNKKIKQKNEELYQSCLKAIDQNKDTKSTIKILNKVVNDEHLRIREVLEDSFESVKSQRISQYECYLQDLDKSKSIVEQNIRKNEELLSIIECISHTDLLYEKDKYMEQIKICETDLQLPSFDVKENSVVKSTLIQAVYSEEEKETLKQMESNHEILRGEKDYFENAFENVMTLLKSVLDYRKNAITEIRKSHLRLPEIPKNLKNPQKKKMKTRRKSAKNELKRFKNIAIELIDLERKHEQGHDKSSKRRNIEDTTHKTTSGESEVGTDQNMELEHKNEQTSTTIATVIEWINICHKRLNQIVFDRDELTLPSGKELDTKEKKTLEITKARLEDISQHIKQLEKEMSSTSKELNEKKEEARKVISEKEKALTSIKQLKIEMSSTSEELNEKKEEAREAILDKKKALERLSKYVGLKLQENNPMVADLNDDYRSTKLGEKYRELYDNEWTDAYRIITIKLRMTEEEAVTQLLELLKEIYETCTIIAKKQINSIFCPMKMEDSEETVMKPNIIQTIKNFQRVMAPDIMISVAEKMYEYCTVQPHEEIHAMLKPIKFVELEDNIKEIEHFRNDMEPYIKITVAEINFEHKTTPAAFFMICFCFGDLPLIVCRIRMSINFIRRILRELLLKYVVGYVNKSKAFHETYLIKIISKIKKKNNYELLTNINQKEIYDMCEKMPGHQISAILYPIEIKEFEEKIEEHSLYKKREDFQKVPGLLKKEKDFQKEVLPDMMIIIEEAIKTTKNNKDKFGKVLELCEAYIQSCIILCWMMNVQDPPVVLEFGVKKGERFNTIYNTEKLNYIKYLLFCIINQLLYFLFYT